MIWYLSGNNVLKQDDDWLKRWETGVDSKGHLGIEPSGFFDLRCGHRTCFSFPRPYNWAYGNMRLPLKDIGNLRTRGANLKVRGVSSTWNTEFEIAKNHSSKLSYRSMDSFFLVSIYLIRVHTFPIKSWWYINILNIFIYVVVINCLLLIQW